MFSVELKFKVGDREVSWDRFANLFLAEAFRSARNEMLPKPTLPLPAPQSSPEAPKSKIEPRVFSIDEAACLLSISPCTVRQYVARRKIASVRIGRRVLVPKEAINDIMQQGWQPAR